MFEEAPERQMTTQEGSTTPGAPEFKLGVLLVHGIGTQRPGETLVRWGDVLLKTIERATRKKSTEGVPRKGVVATIESARPGDGPGKGRFEAAVLLRADGHTERWLLSECWWADAFPAPSYRELVSWSVRALPWSIATHIAERYWQASSHEQDSKEQNSDVGVSKRMVDRVRKRMVSFAHVKAVVQLLGALVFTPVLVAFLGLALLLGLLPIPQIRTAILAVQS